jgi:hypothetical protein
MTPIAASQSLPAQAGSLAPLRSRTGVASIAATTLASGVASYDAYVVNIAEPAIGRHFGASVTAIQWTLTSYLLSLAALLPGEQIERFRAWIADGAAA